MATGIIEQTGESVAVTYTNTEQATFLSDKLNELTMYDHGHKIHGKKEEILNLLLKMQAFALSIEELGPIMSIHWAIHRVLNGGGISIARNRVYLIANQVTNSPGLDSAKTFNRAQLKENIIASIQKMITTIKISFEQGDLTDEEFKQMQMMNNLAKKEEA